MDREFSEDNIEIIKSRYQLKTHYHRHKRDDRIEEPVRSINPEELQSIPMSNKKIEAWKVQVGKGKSIFGAVLY